MKNWTVKEALKVITEASDIESLKELMKHFPMFYNAVVRNDMRALADVIPEKLTVRAAEKSYGVEPEYDTATSEDEEKTVPAKDVKKAATKKDVPLEDMTAKELMKLCDDAGIKVPHYGKAKSFYIEKLNEANGAEVEEAPAEAETENPYEGKTAMELYKLCKKRDINATPKRPAKYYADLLMDADAAEAAPEDDEDDWGDEEEEVKEVKKAPAKGKGKPAKAAPKKAEVVEDEDDDWDI